MGKSFWGGSKPKATVQPIQPVIEPEPVAVAEPDTLTPEERKKRRKSKTILSTDDDLQTTKKQILGVG
jgi:hypothetical protein